MKELINIHILELLFNLHTDESKILTLVITNGRRDMLTRKVFSEKFIFYLNEKNIYDKNISYWIQIYFYWVKIYILVLWKKRWYNENIFYWIQICFDWMKIYFDIMKKGDIMEICFIKYKIILIEWKYIFISYEFLFLQHFSNHARFAFQEDIIDISFFLQIFFLFAFVITNTLTWKKIRAFSLKKKRKS